MKKLISLALVAIMAVTCIGCNAAGGDDKSGEVKSNTDKLTDELVVYVGPYCDDWVAPATRQFKHRYPEVKLTVVDVPDASNAQDVEKYTQTLRTELASGKGPDIFVSGATGGFPDVYKTIASGALYNIDELIANDPDFNSDLYVKSVFDAGIYKGKRYIVPLSYQTNSLMTTEERLAEDSIQLDKLKTFDGFAEQMKQYVEKVKDKPEKNVFYFPDRKFENYFPYSGVQYIDYENQKTTIDTLEFKTVMETCKELYHLDYEDGNDWIVSVALGEIKSINDNKILFSNYYSPDSICGEYMILLDKQTPAYFSFPTFDGKAAVKAADYAGIRANSENKVNAYAFLKLLLSEDVQSGKQLSSTPVLKSSIESKVFERTLGDLYFATDDGEDFVLEKLSNEDAAKITEHFTDVGKCYFYPYELLQQMYAIMEPYFKGEADYDSCLKKLQEMLTIYISE